MAETFYWRVLTDSDADSQFNVNATRFGDGYVQEVPQGINNEMANYNIVVAGYKNYIAPILAFIKAHQGAERFLWTPPLGEQSDYTCKRYRVRYSGGDHYVLTAEFELSYLPSEPAP